MSLNFHAKHPHAPSVENNTEARKMWHFNVIFVAYGLAKNACAHEKDSILEQKKVARNVIPYATNATIYF